MYGEVAHSSDRYRNLIEASGLPAADLDAEKRITYVSDSLSRLLGYAPEELLGRFGPEVVHPDDRALVTANFKRRMGGENIPPYRLRLLSKDGEVVPVELYASPLRDESGAIVGLQCILFDQRPIAALERRLAHSERRFHSLLEGTPDLAFVKDREGRFTDANQAFVEQTGIKREEAIGKRSRDIWPSELVAMAEADDAAVLQGNMVIAERPVSFRGRDAHIMIVKTPLVNEEGQVVGLVGFVRDVTEVHEERKRVVLSERRYRAISKLTSGYVLSLRVEQGGAFSLEWLEGAFEEIVGRPPEGFYEAGGLLSVVHPEDRQILERRREKVLSGESASDEFRILRPDGSVRWIRAFAGPEVDENGRVVRIYAAVADITHEKEMQERAQLMSRFSVLGQLAAGLGHDLNNMMQVVVANLEMALVKRRRSEHGADPAWDYVEKALRASENLTDLSRRLVHFSGPSSEAPTAGDVRERLGSVVAALQDLLPGTHRLETCVPPQPVSVSIETAALQQVLANLVLNSRDAMPEGGLIRVTLQVRRVTRVMTNPLGFTLKPGQHAVIHVDDEGGGIPTEVACRIFEPFVTTRRQAGHSGLGLSIVLQAVTAAGGFVDVKRRLPRGTRFSVYLPLAGAQDGNPAQQSSGKTILIVEDEDDVRSFVDAVLSSEGYSVLTASTAESALQLAARLAKPIDVAVLDVSLPGMDGTGLAERLRKERLARKVAFATAHPLQLDDAIPVLAKPFGRDELIRFVAEVAESERRA